MGASTARALSFNSISRDILGHTSPFIYYLGLRIFMAFQGLLLLEYVGGPEKDRDVWFWWWGFTCALPGFVLLAGCPSV